mmetsp:Transcript_4355/g.13564  ORF Transcript_4355/g.13564 Transcript_4355/m.13564 type:complete len:216 (+) Transcript_4355:417-1064(+)
MSTATWKVACTMMCFHMLRLMRLASRPCGFSCSSSTLGLSVANASAASESMIRFTHSSCITLSGMPRCVTAESVATTSATPLMVSWNCRNLRILEKTQRPHETEATIELKLSSRMTMSDASLATSVPVMPIDRPTSDTLSAGASLVPSPVTATTSPISLSADTSRYLSLGVERASTCSLGSAALRSSSLIFLKAGPSMAVPSVRMPHSRAMCCAV